MADLEDIRRKRRRVFSSASSTPTARNSGVIDLTGDSPEPDDGNLTHTRASNLAPSADSDEALARKLQAQFDLENAQPQASSSTASAIPFLSGSVEDDEAFARKLQAQYNDENQQMIYQSTEEQPETINHDWPNGAHGSQVYSGTKSLLARTLHDTVTPASSFAQTIAGPQLQAQEVQTTIRELIQPIVKTKCQKCKNHILKTESDACALSGQVRSHNTLSSIPKGIPCSSCGATNEHDKDRLLYIWALLCDFDARSKHNKPDKKKRSKATKKTSGNGTGYGGKRRGHASHSEEWATFSSPAAFLNESYGKAGRINTTTAYEQPVQHKLDDDDVMTVKVLNCLTSLLPKFENESPFDFDPPTEQLQALFLCSSILERAAELLRNNDLEDFTGHRGLYVSLASFVKTLASHPSTSSLVFRERVMRTPGVNILKVSHGKADLSSPGETDTTQPLVHCIRELAVQCSTMLRTNDDGSDDMQLFRRIKDLNDFLVVNGGSQKKPAVVGKNGWHKELAVSEVPDEAMLACHSLVGKCAADNSNPGRMKRIMQEVARLEAGLPDGIFVRYADSRPDIMKALIIGPKDTPYEYGLFEFDIICDSGFPIGPPKVQFRTTGGGTFGFNPNLYADGKVCLSLLGTWAGEPWDPKKSTLLQVLVSIQAMIFCESPWANEPGREDMVDADERSKAYNRSLFYSTVQLAMLDWLERRRYPVKPQMPRSRPPGRFGTDSLPGNSAVDSTASIWDEITKRHFDDNAEEIVSTVTKWVQDVISNQPPRPAGLGYDWGAATPASHFGGIGNTLGSSNPPTPKPGPPVGSMAGSTAPTPPGMAARLGSYSDPMGGDHSWMLGATYPHSYGASPSHLPGIPQMNHRALYSKPVWGGGSNSTNNTMTPVTSGQTLSPNPTIGTTVVTLDGDSLPQQLRSAAQKLKSHSRGQMPFY